MSKITRFLKSVFSLPLSYVVRSKVIPDDTLNTIGLSGNEKIFYVIKTNSITDRIVLETACKSLGLPNPALPPTIPGISNLIEDSVICLENPQTLTPFTQPKSTNAIDVGVRLLKAHQNDPTLDVKLIPITIMWGRDPQKETGSIQDMLGDEESPTWLRKFFMVMFSLRHNFLRMSRPVSFRYMADNHGANEATAHKLMRVARVHFYRQKLAASGPKLWSRAQMFNSILGSQTVKAAIKDEISGGTSPEKAKVRTLKFLDEIAADYRGSYIRFGDRALTWFWNKIYSGIQVKNAESVRELAHKGHEIIYVPCHRSHMDYLLLTYVIYHEGMVPPHIAAGVNLNFWPAGTIFRRCGAFFMRRSFKGSKLYSTIFREYLGQLFKKGYPVKFYTEGGRSRSGRLLPPKTGMLAMTLHAMLRDIERPVSLVPVYIGYEHVMEVNTYLKELKGKNKKSESISGVLSAYKSLRDYGHGFVTFGNPINVNEFLNREVDNWRDDMHPIDPPKPTWLTPAVNKLANQVMVHINDATALNAGTLCAIVLLSAKKHALLREQLESQLGLYQRLHHNVEYSELVSVPSESPSQMIDHMLKLQKLDIQKDQFGEIIKLSGKESILMNYYRNNIMQLFIVPSLIAAMILHSRQTTDVEIADAIARLYPLLKDELFLHEQDISNYVAQIINFLLKEKMAVDDDGYLVSAEPQTTGYFSLSMLANISETTLKRFAIALDTLSAAKLLTRSQYETECQNMANRLVKMLDITSPEFFDKKITNAFISSLKNHGFITSNDAGELMPTERFEPLLDSIKHMLGTDFNQIMLYRQS